MKNAKSHSRRMVLEYELRKAGIEPLVQEIDNGFEIKIPLYNENFLSGETYAASPLISETLSHREKRMIVIDLSLFVMRLSQQLIFYTQDNKKDLLKSEEDYVAFSFLQRSSISHICNYKLSFEGITAERYGIEFPILDEYKTMSLTRSLYEHLAMFYYLFCYSDNANQQEIIWSSWKLGSKKNLLKNNIQGFDSEKKNARIEVEELKQKIRQDELVQKCISNPDGQFEYCLNSGSVFTIVKKGEAYVAEKLTYDKAWKYLYGDSNNMMYKYFSLHSHPTYKGLADFNNQQDENIEFSLYESCRFLACLCKLFMKYLKIDAHIITNTLSIREQGIFSRLSN